MKKSGGGFKKTAGTVIMFVVLLAAVIGWARVNNITTATGVYDYFKAVSDKIWSCGAGNLDWNCSSSSEKSNSGSTGSGTTSNKTGSSTSSGNSTTKDNALKTLDSVKIADAQDIDYSRSEWKHWVGSPCDTRETVLKNQGKDVVSDPSTCKITSGTWVDPYSGDTFTDAKALDIDHVIPLSYAASHGGQSWSAEKKQQFANDTTQLYVASAQENRSKSDKGPSDYMPSNKSFRCEYAKTWVSTASKYGLTISEKDKTTLTSALQKCDA